MKHYIYPELKMVIIIVACLFLAIWLTGCADLRTHSLEREQEIWDCATGAERRNNADYNVCVGGWEKQ